MACRLRPVLRSLLTSPTPPLHRSFSHYSTISPVYQHALKTQRPSTIRWRKQLQNSVRFIGTVDRPLKTFTAKNGSLGAHTMLKIQSNPQSNRFLKILLVMWREMAELSIQHLKPNDYIYGSGHLGSNVKAYENGKMGLFQKVTVKEINYVADNSQKLKHSGDPEESPEEIRRNRLHLWQVFFTNPHEWHDLRKCKENPRQPDFKHRSTGEALWLTPYDPPWIDRQLQVQDSRMSDLGLEQNHTSNISPMTYDY